MQRAFRFQKMKIVEELPARVDCLRAHTCAAAVCLYEQGRRSPTVETLARLMAAMGTRLERTLPPRAVTRC